MHVNIKHHFTIFILILSLMLICISGCNTSQNKDIDTDEAENVVESYLEEIQSNEYQKASKYVKNTGSNFTDDDLSDDQITLLDYLVKKSDFSIENTSIKGKDTVIIEIEILIPDPHSVDFESSLDDYLNSLKRAKSLSETFELKVTCKNEKWTITDTSDISDYYIDLVSSVELIVPFPPLPDYLENQRSFEDYIERIGFSDSLPGYGDTLDGYKLYTSYSFATTASILNVEGTDDDLGIVYSKQDGIWEIPFDYYAETYPNAVGYYTKYSNDTYLFILLDDATYEIHIFNENYSISFSLDNVDPNSIDIFDREHGMDNKKLLNIHSSAIEYTNKTIEEFGFINPEAFEESLVPIANLS